MESIFERTFRKDDREYRVAFSFDDEAVMNDAAAFEIKAGVRAIDSNMWMDITLKVDVRFDLGVVVLLHNGREIGRVPLALPLEDALDFEGTNIDIEIDAAAIEEAIGPLAIEEIVHLIPTDPFLGCIVKGAVSTTVGQIIRCWRPTKDTRPYRELGRRIAGCLRDHTTRMLITFMWRCGRCVAFGGFS